MEERAQYLTQRAISMGMAKDEMAELADAQVLSERKRCVEAVRSLRTFGGLNNNSLDALADEIEKEPNGEG